MLALRRRFLEFDTSRRDLTGLTVQLRALSRDSPDSMGELRTRSFQGLAHNRRGGVVANSADVGNGQRGCRIPMLIQDRISNIDDSLHLVTFLLFIAPLLNRGKMRSQITRSFSSVAFAPTLYGTRASFLRLVCQDDMTGSGMHQIHNCTSLNIEARAHRRIHLRDNHDLIPVKHAQMTRLTKFVSNLLHNRQGLHSHAFDRRMLLRESKQVEGKVVIVAVRTLRKVAAFFEA